MVLCWYPLILGAVIELKTKRGPFFENNPSEDPKPPAGKAYSSKSQPKSQRNYFNVWLHDQGEAKKS